MKIVGLPSLGNRDSIILSETYFAKGLHNNATISIKNTTIYIIADVAGSFPNKASIFLGESAMITPQIDSNKTIGIAPHIKDFQ